MKRLLAQNISIPTPVGYPRYTMEQSFLRTLPLLLASYSIAILLAYVIRKYLTNLILKHFLLVMIWLVPIGWSVWWIYAWSSTF